MIGSRLAHYRIEAELGRGGMGIVYRAHDTKLDRTVALKVLPPHALASEDDRARFQREARAAAKLHHAHIASIFEIGEAAIVQDGEDASVAAAASGADVRPFIAMEFIDGETLASRIAAGPLKLTEAVTIASQVAEALKAAHAKDIVHRDVKSANVMLTSDGVAKVLDFGLAKTNASTQLTRQGLTLGTVAYMSPEQARGEDVDGRTDLWALGVVLYEMVAGRLPFVADYEQAALYGILNEDPEPLTAVRTGVPMELEAIVTKLLRKEARLRYQTAADLLADLEAVRGLSGSGAMSAANRSAVRASTRVGPAASDGLSGQRRAGRAMSLVAAGLVVGSVATALLLGLNGRATEAGLDDSLDLVIRLPGLDALSQQQARLDNPTLAISPDGHLVAYEGVEPEKGFVIRDLTKNSPSVKISDNVAWPTFSADSRSIAWTAEGSLLRASVTGGVPTVISDQVTDAVGVTWSRDGYLYLARDYGSGIARISESGGDWEQLTQPDSARGEIGHVCPTMLPDGRTLLFQAYGTKGWELAMADLDSGATTILGPGICPKFVPPDMVFYSQGYRLVAARLDVSAASLGAPETVSESLFATLQSFALQFDVSARGDVLLVEDQDGRESGVVLRRFDGSTETVRPEVFDVEHFRISPDGRYLAIASPYAVSDPDVWIYDFETRDTRRVTSTPTYDAFPVWGPDGTLFFASERRGQSDVYSVDLATMNEQLVAGEQDQQYPRSVSRDGSLVAYDVPSPGRGTDIYVSDVTGAVPMRPLVNTTASEQNASFSPVADLVAYESDETGSVEIYVLDFPPTRPRERITVGGGSVARWSRDGRSLYFLRGNTIYRVGISADGRRSGEPVPVMDGVLGSFELMPDGSGILVSGDLPTKTVRYIARAADKARTGTDGK